MSEHKHVFTYAPYGDLHDQPNAILVCDCGLRILDAYHAACEERDRFRKDSEALVEAAQSVIKNYLGSTSDSIKKLHEALIPYQDGKK